MGVPYPLHASTLAIVSLAIVGPLIWRVLAEERERPHTRGDRWPLPILGLGVGLFTGIATASYLTATPYSPSPPAPVGYGWDQRLRKTSWLESLSLDSGSLRSCGCRRSRPLLDAGRYGSVDPAFSIHEKAAPRPLDLHSGGRHVACRLLGVVLSLHDQADIFRVSHEETGLHHDSLAEQIFMVPWPVFAYIAAPLFIGASFQWLPAIGVAVLGLFPLLVWLVAREVAGQRGPMGWSVPIGRAARLGVLGGVAALAATLVFRAGLHQFVSEDTRASVEFTFSFFYWSMTIVLAAQIITVVLVALTTRAHMVVCALTAGYLVALIGAMALLLGPTIAGCIDPLALRPYPCQVEVSGEGLAPRASFIGDDDDLSWTARVISQATVFGMALAIPIVALVATVGHLVRHRHRESLAAMGSPGPGES